MDIGEVERIGDREMPGLPKFTPTTPAPTRSVPTTPAPTPVKTPEKEKELV